MLDKDILKKEDAEKTPSGETLSEKRVKEAINPTGEYRADSDPRIHRLRNNMNPFGLNSKKNSKTIRLDDPDDPDDTNNNNPSCCF